MEQAFFPCFTTIGFFGLLFGMLAFMRYLRFKETLALAEKGLVRAGRTGANGKDTLRWGVAVTAVGLALCAGLYPVGFLAGSDLPLRFGPWMLGGLIPTFFGLALILIYYLTREDKKPEASETDQALPQSQEAPPPQ